MESDKPEYANENGMEKLIPPFLFVSSISILFPFFEPLAFPNIATSPFTIAITGLIESREPAKAAVEDILPPRFKYSNVSI